MRNLINRKNRGFTLIELLVVIAIIGVLAAVVLVSLNSARLKSRDARRLADTRQVMTALELYYHDNGSYPTSTGAGINVHPDPAAGATGAKFSSYLVAYPSYPTPTNDGGCATPLDYTYARLSSGASYSIIFCLGGTAGGFSSGTHTASPAGLQ